MNKTDRRAVMTMLLLIVLYLAVWAAAYFTNHLPVVLAMQNGITAVTILGHWLLKQLRIKQHIIEIRETVVLGLELLVALLAIYSIASVARQNWLTMFQYITFGVHLLVLVAGTLFMLIFKINKLI